MSRKIACILWTLSISLSLGPSLALAANTAQNKANLFKHDIFTVSIRLQHQESHPDRWALAFHFDLGKDWHFYASEKTAPGGMNLNVRPISQKFIKFSAPQFPSLEIYFDKVLQQEIDVFSDKFTVILPFSLGPELTGSADTITAKARIAIEGAYCSKQQCRIVRDFQLDTKITIAKDKATVEAKVVPPIPPEPPTPSQIEPPATSSAANYSVWLALPLALLAGLSLNIMPCVWPVLPLIVMRIVQQAKQSKAKSTAMGLAFCLGILLFFACLAGANIILQLFYGTVLQWGDVFRNPPFVGAMALLLVVMALFMFGLFTITIPGSIGAKSGAAEGYAGSVGMGFLAAILSTPCSFAILAAAFAWAQAQHWLLGTVAIMTIGLGMAVPYAILTSMPALLSRLPKAGRWMELFKQAIGFILLIIAVKLIAALPQARQMGVLYFAVVLAFAVWMWGSWVSYNTSTTRKWSIRIIAVILAAAGGWALLPTPGPQLIDWQQYDSNLIDTALAQKRPVLIKFTADWCLSCQIAEKSVYDRGDIAELIQQKGVLTVIGDTTEKNLPATIALRDIYKEPGVPVSVLLLPGSKEPIRLHGIFFAKQLKTHLQKLPPR